MQDHRPLAEYQPVPGHVVSLHGSRWSAPLLALFALCGLAGSGIGQDSPLVDIGNRVRLTLHGPRPTTLIGRLMEVGQDSLTIVGKKARDRTVLLRSTVGLLEVSLRQESRVARGLARGAVLGGLLSGAMALVVAGVTPSCEEANDMEWCHKITAGNLVGLLGLGIATGAAMGGVQAAEHPRDVWSSARWRDEVAPPRASTKPLPLIGLGRIGDHRVLLVGLSLVR